MSDSNGERTNEKEGGQEEEEYVHNHYPGLQNKGEHDFTEESSPQISQSNQTDTAGRQRIDDYISSSIQETPGSMDYRDIINQGVEVPGQSAGQASESLSEVYK